MGLQGWDWRGNGASGRNDGEKSSGLVSFTSAESKRLIAKAIAALPEVKAALRNGRVIILGGTTNAFVAEEILGKPVPKEYYIKGSICAGFWGTTNHSNNWVKPFVLVNGLPVDAEPLEVLKDFDARDVYIKGANAVDPEGHAGILMAGPTGGNIGGGLGILMARGSHLIVPVGLEKLIPSVIAASRKCGINRLRYPDGATLGLMPLVAATVVTEIEALRQLAGVEATHVASGGIGGSEGSVMLAVEGPDERVRAAFELWESIKGEPPVPASPIAARYGIDVRSGVVR